MDDKVEEGRPAKRRKVVQHHHSLHYKQEGIAPDVALPAEDVDVLLKRSIVLALKAAGVDSAEPRVLDAFRSVVEDCGFSFLVSSSLFPVKSTFVFTCRLANYQARREKEREIRSELYVADPLPFVSTLLLLSRHAPLDARRGALNAVMPPHTTHPPRFRVKPGAREYCSERAAAGPAKTRGAAVRVPAAPP
jgi:hypothetical protein